MALGAGALRLPLKIQADLDTVPHRQVTELGGFHADEWIVEVGRAFGGGFFFAASGNHCGRGWGVLASGKKLMMNQE